MTPPDIRRDEVRAHFSAHADEYDRYAVVQKRVVAQLLERLPAAPPTGLWLDLGCGTGELAQALRQIQPSQPLLVADIAHGMTCHAAERVADVFAVDADAEALPLADASCSLILSSSMYQWVDDLGRAFAENWRVIRPGGTFLFALFGRATLHELRASHRAALAEAGNPYPSHMQSFPETEAVQKALAAAGFAFDLWSNEEVEHHPDVATLLRHLKKIGAQNASSKRPPGLASRRVTQRMIDLYGERFAAPQGIPATYEVIYGIATKKGDA